MGFEEENVTGSPGRLGPELLTPRDRDRPGGPVGRRKRDVSLRVHPRLPVQVLDESTVGKSRRALRVEVHQRKSPAKIVSLCATVRTPRRTRGVDRCRVDGRQERGRVTG